MYALPEPTKEILHRLSISEGTRRLNRSQTEAIIQSFSFRLESTMDLPDVVPVLEMWMDKWKTSESYLFLKQVDEFMCLKATKNRIRKANEIMDHFVRAKSKYEINIAYETREKLLNQWDSQLMKIADDQSLLQGAEVCPRTLFDVLSIQVLHMMKTDIFDRFIHSREFVVFMVKIVQRKGLLWFLSSMDAYPKRAQIATSSPEKGNRIADILTPRSKRKRDGLPKSISHSTITESTDEDVLGDSFVDGYDDDDEEEDEDDDNESSAEEDDGIRTIASFSTLDPCSPRSGSAICSTTVLTNCQTDQVVSPDSKLSPNDDSNTGTHQTSPVREKQSPPRQQALQPELSTPLKPPKRPQCLHHLHSFSRSFKDLTKEEAAHLLKTYIKIHESCQELRVTPFFFKRGLVIVSPRHEKLLMNTPAVRDSEKEASAFRKTFHVNNTKRINGYITRIHLDYSYLQVFNLFYNAKNRIRCDGNMLDMGFVRYHSTIDTVQQRLNELMRRKGLSLKDFDTAIEYAGSLSYETFKMPFPLTDRFCQVMSSMKHETDRKRILVVRQSLRMKKAKKRGMTQMDHVGLDIIEADPNDPNRCTLTMWAAINFGSWMPSNVFFHGISDRIRDQYNNFVTNLRMREQMGLLDKKTDDTWGKAVLRGCKENDDIDNLVMEAKKAYFGASFVPTQDSLDSDTEH